jgi:hypothetical protein
MPLMRVPGMHAGWLDDAAGFAAAIRPRLESWRAASAALRVGG